MWKVADAPCLSLTEAVHHAFQGSVPLQNKLQSARFNLNDTIDEALSTARASKPGLYLDIIRIEEFAVVRFFTNEGPFYKVLTDLLGQAQTCSSPFSLSSNFSI